MSEREKSLIEKALEHERRRRVLRDGVRELEWRISLELYWRRKAEDDRARMLRSIALIPS